MNGHYIVESVAVRCYKEHDANEFKKMLEKTMVDKYHRDIKNHGLDANSNSGSS